MQSFIFLPLLRQFIYSVYTFICVHVCVHMSMWKSEDSFRELVLSDFHHVESAHHAKQKAFLSAKPSHWSFVFCFLLCLYVSLLSVLGVQARQFLCLEATSPATLFCCWFCFAASVLGDWTQVLLRTRRALYWLSHFPRHSCPNSSRSRVPSKQSQSELTQSWAPTTPLSVAVCGIPALPCKENDRPRFPLPSSCIPSCISFSWEKEISSSTQPHLFFVHCTKQRKPEWIFPHWPAL